MDPLRRLAAIAALLLAPGLAACAGESTTTRLVMGHGLDVSHPVHRALVYLAERAAAGTHGSLEIAIHPAEQLGSERECLELLQIGSLDLTKVSSSVLENFVPEFRVLGVPYLFRDDAHRFAVLDGEIGQRLLRSAENRRLRGLGWFDAGTRSFYTRDRPIRSPDDLAGLKIRTQESPMAIATVRRLGGSATPIAWGELYTALQQGVVDGAENNPPSFHTSHHYEVARYYTLDRHTAVPDVLLISTRAWRGLDAEQRAGLEAAVREAEVLQRRLWREATERALEVVRAAGVAVIEPDLAAFAARTAPLRDELASDSVLGPLLRAVAEVGR
jgi:tripartite ATP-independent transporter DctP family solute receptor